MDYTALSASDGSGEAVRATVQSPGRDVGSSAIPVDAITNWPTGTFIATTGTLQVNNTLTNAQVFYGTASGTTITITSFAPGYTDLGSSIGDVVVLKPTTEWANIIGALAANITGGGTPQPLTASTLTIVSNNQITAANLATNAITLGYAQITSNDSETSLAQVSGLSAAVTIPPGGRNVKITAWTGRLSNATAGDQAVMSLWDGTVGSGTQLAQASFTAAYSTGSPAFGSPAIAMAIVTPAAGSKTYNVGLYNNGAGTAWLAASSTSPAFILVEAI